MPFASRLGGEKWLCALPLMIAAASSRYPIPALAFRPLRFRTYSIDSIALMRLPRGKTEGRDSGCQLSGPFVRHTARRSMWRAVHESAAPLRFFRRSIVAATVDVHCSSDSGASGTADKVVARAHIALPVSASGLAQKGNG